VQFFTSVSEPSCHYCEMKEARTQRPLFRAWENRQSTSYNLSFPRSYVQFLSSTRCYKGVITRWSLGLLSFSNQRGPSLSPWALDDCLESSTSKTDCYYQRLSLATIVISNGCYAAYLKCQDGRWLRQFKNSVFVKDFEREHRNNRSHSHTGVGHIWANSH